MNHPRPVSGALSRQSWSNFIMPSRISSRVSIRSPFFVLRFAVFIDVSPFTEVQKLTSLSAVPEQNHIAFLHDVLFPLQPHLRLLPRRRQTPRRQQIIPTHHFRPDKTLLDVAMNRSCCLHCCRALANRPRAHFRLPCREELDQPHQV